MGWRKRLLELGLAGGALGLATGFPGPFFACNANPDPCCSQPHSTACAQWNACRDAGGEPQPQVVDASLQEECVFPAPDAGRDGGTDGGDGG